MNFWWIFHHNWKPILLTQSKHVMNSSLNCATISGEKSSNSPNSNTALRNPRIIIWKSFWCASNCSWFALSIILFVSSCALRRISFENSSGTCEIVWLMSQLKMWIIHLFLSPKARTAFSNAGFDSTLTTCPTTFPRIDSYLKQQNNYSFMCVLHEWIFMNIFYVVRKVPLIWKSMGNLREAARRRMRVSISDWSRSIVEVPFYIDKNKKRMINEFWKNVPFHFLIYITVKM